MKAPQTSSKKLNQTGKIRAARKQKSRLNDDLRHLQGIDRLEEYAKLFQTNNSYDKALKQKQGASYQGLASSQEIPAIRPNRQPQKVRPNLQVQIPPNQRNAPTPSILQKNQSCSPLQKPQKNTLGSSNAASGKQPRWNYSSKIPASPASIMARKG